MVILPGKNCEYRVDIPARCLGEILSPRQVHVPTSWTDLLLEAFLHPVGCRPLAELATPGQSILIIVDDNTRSTPTQQVLPVLLAHLAAAGCQPEDITLAIALGTHRPMTATEIELKLGRPVALRFPVINDSAHKGEVFVATGEFLNGVPIEVHRAVLNADLVIGIGSVVPHTEAGWSGGCKMILPGMCSERTVMENHRLAADTPGNALGQEATPVRQNMEEIVARIGFDFSINLVLTSSGGIIGAFAGHFVAAQRAAVEAARQVYAVPYRERADIVVSNAHPAEIDFWQASKGIWSGELLVKSGGTVILNAPCPEGIGPHPNFLELIQVEPEELGAGLASGAIADVSAAALALPVARMLDHMRLSIVSPNLPADQLSNGRISHHASLNEAVDAALAHATSDPGSSRCRCKISVLTHGGYTFPVPAVV